ncbi:MAG: stalk domain-containing protein [Armatimonadota bacterium]
MQIAIGTPVPNSLVAGRITLGIAYNTERMPINAFTVFVDDVIQYSRDFSGPGRRGIQYLELDTRMLADGVHMIKIVANGPRGRLAVDEVRVTVKNGLMGGPDLVPPLLQFKDLIDGQTVSGEIDIQLLAEDNDVRAPLVSLFVNRQPRFFANKRPYILRLNTAEFLDPATGTGTLRLDAFAVDGSDNQGTARPLTLNVVPATSGRLTPALPDPTKPGAGPAFPDADLKGEPVPATIPMGGTPSSMRAEMPLKSAPSLNGEPVTGSGAGSPVIEPGVRVPGDRPLGPLVAKNRVQGISPEFVPFGPGSRSGLAGPRASVPNAEVPTVPAAPEKAVKPEPAIKVEPAEPAVLSAPVERKPEETAPVKPKPTLQAKAIPAKPALPSPRIESSAPVVMMVDPDAKPDKEGRVPVEVYQVNPATKRPALPKDRTYQVRKGDTLTGVARKLGVTTRSLMVANGIRQARSLQAGATIKVPGSFEVVMNNQQVAFDVNPRIENGLPLAPFRQIFEQTGGVVVWYPETQEVRAANDLREIKLVIGSKEARVNQVVVVMDKEAYIDSGRTIVPISFLEKALELKAEYDVKRGTIVLGPK